MTIDFLFGWADVAAWALILAAVMGCFALVDRADDRFHPGEWRRLVYAAAVLLAAAAVCAIIDVLVNHLRWVP